MAAHSAWARLVLALVALSVAASCTAASSPDASGRAATPRWSSEPSVALSPSPQVSPSPNAAPTLTPPPTASPSIAFATPTPAAVVLARDTVAVVVATDGLVIRSKPEISAASEIFRPSLPAGAELYVWDGPVRADGYAWYRVLPLSAKYQSGWVAAASKTGEPWIESGNATCPKTPTTVAGVAQMPGGVGLAGHI